MKAELEKFKQEYTIKMSQVRAMEEELEEKLREAEDEN